MTGALSTATSRRAVSSSIVCPGWVSVPRTSSATSSTAPLPPGANRGRYFSPRADRIIETARTERDPEHQTAHYRELQALLLEELS